MMTGTYLSAQTRRYRYLKMIKEDDNLKDIPVVITSTSNTAQAIKELLSF
ncbi:hypothetical protein H4J38_13665 [Colwellia sp. BRX10-3]|nr:hypothetical protein [Colwellia sp. BRX10-3]